MTQTLYQGNCFDVLPEIADESVDLILIDPPYAISRKTNFRVSKNIDDMTPMERKYNISMDFGEWDHVEIDLLQLCQQCFRILKKHGTFICFYDLWKIGDVHDAMIDNGFKQIRLIEWIKSNPVPINSNVNYLTNAREVAVLGVKAGKPTFNSTYDTGIYTYAIPQRKENTHPTAKPLQFMRDLVKKHSNEKDIVLDCFMGGGTTGAACVLENRHFIGIERDEKYFDIAKNYIDKMKNNG